MSLSFQKRLLSLHAPRILFIQLSAGFQRPPVRDLVFGALMAGPGGDGHKKPGRQGFGKVGAAPPGEIAPDVANSQELPEGHSPHRAVVIDGRDKVHAVASIGCNRLWIGNYLYLRHVPAGVQHGVEVFSCLI